MTSTTILIALGILLILVAVYFIAKKMSSVAMLQKLAGSNMPIKDRIVGEHINLPPGTIVQRSGNYECLMCAYGGVQDTTAAAFLGEAEARRRAQARMPTRTFFEKNAKLPTCPNCSYAAGWTLVK